MRRTSLKAFLACIAVLSLSVYAGSVADEYYLSTGGVSFGLHQRPMNHWDYVASAAFLVFFALVAVGLMFLNKDD